MTRTRGLAPYRPQGKTRALLAQVDAVLAEYAEHLPLTIRQLFYRLVGAFGYPKDENAYGRLTEALNRARRSGLVAFEAIRDDGPVELDAGGFSGLPGFWGTVAAAAGEYRRERLAGQPFALELWTEAGGMAPQLERAVADYGVSVFSSGGFDSLTVKYDAARRIARRDRPTVVLHVGDHDPSGVALFQAAAEDVAMLVDDLGGFALPTFERVAVRPEHVDEYELETAPAKAHDKRGAWQGGGTVQAEALAPDLLAGLVRAAVERYVERETFEAVLDVERDERAALVEQLERFGA